MEVLIVNLNIIFTDAREAGRRGRVSGCGDEQSQEQAEQLSQCLGWVDFSYFINPTDKQMWMRFSFMKGLVPIGV